MRIQLGVWVLAFVLVMSSARALGYLNLEEKSSSIVVEMRQNFSMPETEKITIFLASVANGAAEARRYPIRGAVIKLDGIELSNISDDELAGLMAHELAHLETYWGMNWLQLAFYGLRYEFSGDFRREAERETDMIAIQRGFGRELASFREYRLRTARDADKKIIEEYYLSPEEIKTFTNKSLS